VRPLPFKHPLPQCQEWQCPQPHQELLQQTYYRAYNEHSEGWSPEEPDLREEEHPQEVEHPHLEVQQHQMFPNNPLNLPKMLK